MASRVERARLRDRSPTDRSAARLPFCGIPLTGDETIQITVSSGSAIVYGSTTDNITNDPAVQFAYGLFGIA